MVVFDWLAAVLHPLVSDTRNRQHIIAKDTELPLLLVAVG